MTSRYEKGVALLNKLHGGHTGAALVESMQDICPDYATLAIEFGYADILSRPGLDLLSRHLVIISSCVTLGSALPQLKAYIEATLELGGSKEQIIETILQTLPFAGFPAVTNAFTVAKEVFSR